MTRPFPSGIAFDDAIAIIRDVAATYRLDTETIATARADGRVLREDVVAAIALPPFDNSAMDGFAYRHADLAGCDGVLRLAGDQFAGHASDAPLADNACVRITTGAPLPPGADTIAIKEVVGLDCDRVRIPRDIGRGAFVRRAGEDVRAGDVVLRAGDLLTPVRVSLCAALGVASVRVSRRPTVAVFTSGDELVEPGLPLAHGQVYDSNRSLLLALLRADGLEPTAWPRLPDDARQMEVALRDAACAFDVVITCGAASVGEKDFIPDVLQRFGTVHFWKVRMKPGMPALLASVDVARVLALPGNPVSVLATYLTLGRALLDGLQGRIDPRPMWHARLSAPIGKSHARREFMRGRLHCDASGTLGVDPDGATASNRLNAAARSDALIVVEEGAQLLAEGSVVAVMPY